MTSFGLIKTAISMQKPDGLVNCRRVLGILWQKRVQIHTLTSQMLAFL